MCSPGEHWADAIAGALEPSIGFLVFVSSRSMQSLTMQSELDIALGVPDRLIIPVVRDEPADPPPWLAGRQWMPLAEHPTADDLSDAAAAIADVTEHYLAQTPSPTAPVTETEAPLIAADIANDLRSSEPAAAHERPRSVFVVHGHDTAARSTRRPTSAIERCSSARQNVLLELGFFYGRLGWENVFVVYHAPDQVFPNFERPSDLDGVVFDSLSDDYWRVKLGTKLAAAGFELDGSRRPAWACGLCAG